MKAVSKTMKAADYRDQPAFRLDKKLQGLMTQAIDDAHFTPEFANHEMFREFRRGFFIDYQIDMLFESELIDFVHIDNAYDAVEVVETIEGTVLCVPPACSVTEFMATCDELTGETKKATKKPDK